MLVRHIKSAFTKIGVGLLYGIGIGISASVVIYVITEKMLSESLSNASENVAITSHKEIKRDGVTYVLGTLKNQGTQDVRSVNIEADFFDANGNFVEQCSEFVAGSIKPSETRNFKISCSNCKNPSAVEHASYKLRIVGL